MKLRKSIFISGPRLNKKHSQDVLPLTHPCFTHQVNSKDKELGEIYNER